MVDQLWAGRSMFRSISWHYYVWCRWWWWCYKSDWAYIVLRRITRPRDTGRTANECRTFDSSFFIVTKCVAPSSMEFLCELCEWFYDVVIVALITENTHSERQTVYHKISRERYDEDRLFFLSRSCCLVEKSIVNYQNKTKADDDWIIISPRSRIQICDRINKLLIYMSSN